MKLLVLGGTRFLGRAAVEQALARSHRVTVLNRGITGRGLFPDAEQIVVDRWVPTALPPGRNWDAVVDISGDWSEWVRRTVDALVSRAGFYAYVSSAMVYASLAEPGITEAAPTIEPFGAERSLRAEKRSGEALVEGAFGDRALIVRPTLLIGANDTTGRFSYWPWRVRSGGTVLAPGDPGDRLSATDVDDLAAWMMVMLERGASGTFNVTGQRMTIGDVLAASMRAADASPRVEWVGHDFLLERGVREWTEIPLWATRSNPASAGAFSIDGSKAERAGLRFRDLAATAAAVLQHGRPPGPEVLNPARELELIEAWRRARG